MSEGMFSEEDLLDLRLALHTHLKEFGFRYGPEIRRMKRLHGDISYRLALTSEWDHSDPLRARG